jgi:hypothetical protein
MILVFRGILLLLFGLTGHKNTLLVENVKDELVVLVMPHK